MRQHLAFFIQFSSPAPRFNCADGAAAIKLPYRKERVYLRPNSDDPPEGSPVPENILKAIENTKTELIVVEYA